MTPPPDEPMWAEFKPLWGELSSVRGLLLVAGGYGLLLKQHWLRSERAVRIVVGLDRWLDANPRVTKDVDIVVGLDLIASADAQARMAKAMEQHQFVVTESNPRWQFRKDLGNSRVMLVEFHSPLPPPGSEHLQMDKIRVKHKPSLGEGGIHGRQNPEAVGCQHHPFRFEIDGLAIHVPHPVFWCVMKLIAMRDRYEKAEDKGRSEEVREFEGKQAVKHAQDVCRAIAMTTQGENDQALGVADLIRANPSFEAAVEITGGFFSSGGWGTRVVAGAWRDEDLTLIRSTLVGWFH